MMYDFDSKINFEKNGVKVFSLNDHYYINNHNIAIC